MLLEVDALTWSSWQVGLLELLHVLENSAVASVLPIDENRGGQDAPAPSVVGVLLLDGRSEVLLLEHSVPTIAGLRDVDVLNKVVVVVVGQTPVSLNWLFRGTGGGSRAFNMNLATLHHLGYLPLLPSMHLPCWSNRLKVSNNVSLVEGGGLSVLLAQSSE